MLISISALASALTLLGEHPDPLTIVVSQVSLGLYGYCAWVGWRNVGILTAVADRRTVGALLLLAALLLLDGTLISLTWASASSEGVKLGEGQERQSIFGIGGALLSSGTALLALAGLFLVRRRAVPYVGLNVREFFSRVTSLGAEPLHLKAKRPVAGAVLLTLGVIWLVGLRLIPDQFVYGQLGLYRVIGSFDKLGFVAFIFARHFFAPDVSNVLHNDHRPPVLLLRSFADEEKLQYLNEDQKFFDFSLESRLASHFERTGPFVAIGAPGDARPHLGAARVQLSDAEWQAQVLAWMNESARIVLMAGSSHWIQWELRQVIELGHATKLIVLFPPVGATYWRAARSTAPRFEAVKKAFEASPWAAAVNDLRDHKRIRSLAFLPDGSVVAVTSKPGNRDACQLAALIADDAVRTGITARAAQTSLAPVGAHRAVLPLATLGQRAVASGLDALVAGAPLVAALSLSEDHPRRAVALVGAGMLAVAYFALGEWLTGGTIGKALVGLEVRKANGERCSGRAAVVRSLFRIVDGFGCYLVGFAVADTSPFKQRIGDRGAGTIVVRSQRRKPMLLLAGACLVAATAFGLGMRKVWLQSMSNPGTLSPDIPAVFSGRMRVGEIAIGHPSEAPAPFSLKPKHAPLPWEGLPKAEPYRPGDKLDLTFQVGRFVVDSKGRANIESTVKVFDPAGRQVAEPLVARFTDAATNHSVFKQKLSLTLPEFAPVGVYKIDLVVRNLVSGDRAALSPHFEVRDDGQESRGEAAEDLSASISSSSGIGSLLQLGSPPAPPDGKLYLDIQVRGLTFADDRPHLTVGLELTDSMERVVFDEPKYLEFNDSVFYHPPGFITRFQATLGTEGHPLTGFYRARVRVRDELSGQSASADTNFFHR